MHQVWSVRKGRGRKEIYACPTRSTTKSARSLDFCACHGIEPMVEMFPMSDGQRDAGLTACGQGPLSCGAEKRFRGISIGSAWARRGGALHPRRDHAFALHGARCLQRAPGLRSALIVNYRSRPNAAAELLEYLSFNAKVDRRQSGALVPSVLNRQLAIKRVRADS